MCVCVWRVNHFIGIERHLIAWVALMLFLEKKWNNSRPIVYGTTEKRTAQKWILKQTCIPERMPAVFTELQMVAEDFFMSNNSFLFCYLLNFINANNLIKIQEILGNSFKIFMWRCVHRKITLSCFRRVLVSVYFILLVFILLICVFIYVGNSKSSMWLVQKRSKYRCCGVEKWSWERILFNRMSRKVVCYTK